MLLTMTGLCLSWRLLLWVSLAGINIESEWPRVYATAVIVAVGDCSVVPPMIKLAGKVDDYDGVLSDALIRLNNRCALNREPNLSLIVNEILSKNVGSQSCWRLIFVLENVTGKSFEDPDHIESGNRFDYEAEVKRKTENIRRWCEGWHCAIRKELIVHTRITDL